MRRSLALVRAFSVAVCQDTGGDGAVSEPMLRYLCTLAAFAACGPGNTDYARQASALQTEIVAAYAAAGFPVGRCSATGEPVYERAGLASIAREMERTIERRR